MKTSADRMASMANALEEAVEKSFKKALEYATENGGWLEETMDQIIQDIVDKSLSGKIKEVMIEKVKNTMLKDPEFIANLTAKAIFKAVK